MITQRTLFNLIRNPRRGTRRFAGSTQAAARARRAPAPAAPAAAPKRASVKRAPSAKGVKGVLGDLLSKLPFRFDDWYVRGEYTKIWLADNFISDGAIVLYKHGMTAPNIAKFGKASDKQRMMRAQVLPQVGQDVYKEESVLKGNIQRRAFQPLYFACDLMNKNKWFPVEAPIGLPVKSGKFINNKKILYRVQSDNGRAFDLKLIRLIQHAVGFDHVEESTELAPLLFFFKNDRLVALLMGLNKDVISKHKWLPVSEVLSDLKNQG